MKISAAIILYNPNYELVISKLQTYSKCFDHIYIYDNTENNQEYKCLLRSTSKLTYYFNGKNDGLCVPYNKILKDCIVNNTDFLCTLDQDSDFSTTSIYKIKQNLSNMDTSNIGIAGPRIIYDDNITVSQSASSIQKVKWIISSGSFININIIRKENVFFDEYYFIDRFEVDFCTQLYEKGYDIIMFNDIYLKQSLGYKYKNHSCHNSIRHYYISRNRIYYNKKFKKHYLLISILQTMRHFTLVILFEDKKMMKLKYIVHGIFDFFLRKD